MEEGEDTGDSILKLKEENAQLQEQLLQLQALHEKAIQAKELEIQRLRSALKEALVDEGEWSQHASSIKPPRISEEECVRKRVAAWQDVEGRTELHRAVECNDTTSVLALLASKRALIDLQDDDGEASLHKAAINGFTDLVEMLLKAGANPYLRDRNGRTALHSAVHYGNEGAVELLCGYDAVNALQDTCGHTALLLAVCNENEKIVKILLNLEGDRSRMHSRRNNLPECVSDVIKSDSATIPRCESRTNLVNIQNINGSTPLHLAVTLGQIEVVKILIAAGAKSHLQDRWGTTALHNAVRHELQDIVEVICDNDSGNSLQDEDGRTALHYAVMHKYVGIVKQLLFSGVPPYMKNNKQESALGYAFKLKFYNIANTIISLISLRGIVIEFNCLTDEYYCREKMDECDAEIHRMKYTQVAGSSISYYDVATRHVSKVAVYLENADIRKVLLRETVHTFPVYANLIAHKVKKAEARRILINQNLECFSKLSGMLLSLPRTIIYNVFSCLKDLEMQSLLEASSTPLQ